MRVTKKVEPTYTLQLSQTEMSAIHTGVAMLARNDTWNAETRAYYASLRDQLFKAMDFVGSETA